MSIEVTPDRRMLPTELICGQLTRRLLIGRYYASTLQITPGDSYCAVFMLMMRVWVMLVSVRQRLMMMRMGMSCAWSHRIGVVVLMVCVVGVLMLVVESQMGMRVFMFLGQMKP